MLSPLRRMPQWSVRGCTPDMMGPSVVRLPTIQMSCDVVLLQGITNAHPLGMVKRASPVVWTSHSRRGKAHGLQNGAVSAAWHSCKVAWQLHSHAHMCTHACTHARTRACMHAHACTHVCTLTACTQTSPQSDSRFRQPLPGMGHNLICYQKMSPKRVQAKEPSLNKKPMRSMQSHSRSIGWPPACNRQEKTEARRAFKPRAARGQADFKAAPT